MNIGFKPTVGSERLSIEVHFLDFEGDLYDQNIQVALLKFLRPETKFDSISSLKVQLEKDKNDVLLYVKKL